MEDRVKKILCVLMVLGVAPCFFVEAMQRQAMRVQESPAASGVSRTSSISGPRLMKFCGTLKDANGLPLTGIVGVTFSLYANEQGGAPLWLENQNVQLDEQGNYAVVLGSTTASGLTVELFASTEPRWLGVQSQSQDAQSRILLNGRVSLPEDWTDHTVVFSKPADSQTASQLSHDPRYLKQQYGRNLAGSRNPNVTNPAAAADAKGGGKKNPPPPGTPQGDWNYSLGNSSSARVAPNMFPAKYNFDINQAPSCTADFVVFGENVTGNAQAVAASRIGTFSSTASGGTITIDGTSLNASPATAASQTGSFSAPPLSGGSLTITNGANILTLTNNGSGSHSMGTFSASPAANTSVSITSGSNTLAMTTDATAGSAVGTFSAPAGPGAGSITITNSSGASPNTLTLTNNGTGSNAIGTFSASPAANTSISIASGSNTLAMTTNATPGSAVGTFSAPTSPAAGSITITNSSSASPNTLTLTNNGTGSKATGTFSGAPVANTSVSVTSGLNTLAMTTNATPGTVIGTFSAPPAVGGSITITDSSGASPNTLTLT